MKKSLLPLIGIAFAVALLATVLFYGLFFSRMQTPVSHAGTPILVAARSLERGTELKPADVKIVTWGNAAAIKGSYTSPEQVMGLSLIQPLQENEPVTEARVASRTSGAGAGLGIPAGMRAVSIHVVDSTGVVAMLRPGHKIDVQVVATPGRNQADDLRLRTMLQHIEVLSVNAQAELSSGRHNGQILTLLATPAEADLLGLADSMARLRVTLRNPLDHERRRPASVVQPALFEQGTAAETPRLVRVAAKGGSAGMEPALALGSRVAFKVQVAAADPVALKELVAQLETPPNPGTLQVVAFRRGSDVEAAVRSLRARNLIDLFPPSSLTAGHRREVSMYNPLDDGDKGCRMSIRLSPSIDGDSHLRLRVQPEIVSWRGGSARGIDTEVDLADGQSLLVAGLIEPREREALLKRILQGRGPESANWDLVVLVTSQFVRPFQTAVLREGR